MRHIVNFGLLFSFGTLAVSGIMSFVLPFSLVTARVHVVFGLTTLILVGLHLLSRVAYFRSQLMPRSRNKGSHLGVLGVAACWMVLLAIAVAGWKPAELVVEQGYEFQHRAEIVRASPLTGYADHKKSESIVSRVPGADANTSLSLVIRFSESAAEPPVMAVWAESTTGSMIETLYIDPRAAYSDNPKWCGTPIGRHRILPIWRHRYTLVSGIEPNGQVDAVTSATPAHRFTLDNYLRTGSANEFVLCVEFNAHGDTNESYQDPIVGQPSLLYTAYVEIDSPQPYSLLELTGHGAGAEDSGAVQYDLENITTAKQLVDLVLAKVERVDN